MTEAELCKHLTRCKPGSEAHKLVANWPVPACDTEDLVYLGSQKGYDLYYSRIHLEIVIRYGAEPPDYSAVQIYGLFWGMMMRQPEVMRRDLYIESRRRAVLADIIQE